MPSSVLAPVALTAAERAQLESWTRRRTSAQALAMRSRIVLLAADGRNNTEIAGALAIRRNVAGKWRSRFVKHRLDGLLDEPRPGRPRTITDEQVEEVVITPGACSSRRACSWCAHPSPSSSTPRPPRATNRRVRARARERGVRPVAGQLVRRGDDARPFDRAALHPVAGQRVGVLDVPAT
jgi:transposase